MKRHPILHHPHFANALIFLLFMSICTSIQAQEYDWEAVKKRVDIERKEDADIAIATLETAREEIKEKLGTGHEYYSACLRELIPFYQRRDVVKLRATMAELQKLNTARFMASQEEEAKQYEQQVQEAMKQRAEQVKSIAEQTKQREEEARQAALQMLEQSRMQQSDMSTVNSWPEAFGKLQYKASEGPKAIIEAYKFAREKLPEPKAEDYTFVSIASLVGNQYQSIKDLRGERKHYEEVVSIYQNQLASSPDNATSRQYLKMFKDKLAKLNEATVAYEYPPVASVTTWTALSKILFDRMKSRAINDRHYEGVIDYYKKVAPTITKEKLGAKTSCLLSVGRAFDQLNQRQKKIEFFTNDINAFERRRFKLRPYVSTDQRRKELYMELSNACKKLYDAIGQKEKAAEIRQELREIQQAEWEAEEKAGEEKSAWKDVSAKIMVQYSSQNYEEIISIFEAEEARLGTPKGFDQSYFTILGIASMAYGQTGNAEKQKELAAKANENHMMMLDPEARKNMKEMTAAAERMTANNQARTEAADIADRLGTDTPLGSASDYYSAYNTESSVNYMKRMFKQTIADNPILLETDPGDYDMVFDSLSRAWGEEAISKFDQTAADNIPADANFDEVFNIFENARKGLSAKMSESLSGVTDEIQKIGKKAKTNTRNLIGLYDSLATSLQNFKKFSTYHQVAIQGMSTQNADKKIKPSKAVDMVLTVMAGADQAMGEEMTKPERDEFKDIISGYFASIDRYSRLVDYEKLNSIDGNEKAGVPNTNYFQLLSDQIKAHNDPENQASNDKMIQFFTFMRDELSIANSHLNLFGVDEINELKLGSRQVEQWVKSREVMLQIAWKGHQEGVFNLFDEEDAMLTFDQIIKSKAGDYKTRRFIQRGVQASNDQELKAEYDSLRQKKAEIGQVYLMPDSLRELTGWDSLKLANHIEESREIERTLFQKIVRSSDFGTFYSQHAIKWKEIQGLLQPGEAFVDIERLPSFENEKQIHYLFFIIRPDTLPVITSVENGFDLDTRYYRMNRNLIKHLKTDGKPYEQYWKPIESHLTDVSKVYLSRDGVYHKLSPGTLFNPTTEKFLIDELEIVTLAEISDIKSFYQSDADSVAPDEYVLFGHPDYNLEMEGDEKTDESRAFKTRLSKEQRLYLSRKPLKDLDGTIEEVDQISQLAEKNGITTSIFMDEQATETELRSVDSPDVLHIATHGSFKPGKKKIKRELTFAQERFLENPMLRSYLFLAGANLTLKAEQAEGEDDGIVSAEDIAHMDLSATDLVVLSACETGLGETYNGEGVFGLQRSFLTAGAKTVIMSLWTVDDEATQMLMTGFYRNMLENGMGKWEAFRQSQLAVKEELIHPYFWGAFVMIGE